MMTDQAGVYIKVTQEFPGDTCVFSGYDVRLTQDAQRTNSDVFQISDWRCHETKTPRTCDFHIQGVGLS
jgi:hypothetical protein